MCGLALVKICSITVDCSPLFVICIIGEAGTLAVRAVSIFHYSHYFLQIHSAYDSAKRAMKSDNESKKMDAQQKVGLVPISFKELL